MAVLRANEIQGFIAEPPSKILGVLIYGPNEGRVANTASKIVKSVLGTLDDPFNLVHLNEGLVKDTNGLLRDEMLALSFTGARKIIWVKDPGSAVTKQLSNFFDSITSENLLVIQTGQLKKTSTLRKIFETSKHAIAIPCYEDSRQDLSSLITHTVNKAEKNIEKESIETLIDNVGNDRSLLLSEIEKLICYCTNDSEITVADIEALCANPLNGNLDELCDLTLTGDVNRCLKQFSHLTASGVQSTQILNTISSHLMRLQRYRIDIDKGQNIDTVIKSSRPPIFFKRQFAVKRQLSSWQGPRLTNALNIVFESILQTRQNPGLDENICERTLIALSKRAQTYAR